MNIAYLTQLTNLDISDKAPLEYINDYDKNNDFEKVLEWTRNHDMPEDALDQFIELRIDAIIEKLKYILSDISFEYIYFRYY